MAVREILLLGDPQLYEVNHEISPEDAAALQPVVEDLQDTLREAQVRLGRGRAIAAPQIGVFKRLICLSLDEPTVMINPRLTDLSVETFELWDDCLSFPNLLVRVRRHRSCVVSFWDLQGQTKRWTLQGDLAELIQHEHDHLDGILSVQRAVDLKSFSLANRQLRGVSDR
ncbi:MAG: peptide deformylase [candidate division Zixibacteria bacterium]|nr:peptide deformylase [candidate division Zixibacteria bacterium]